MNEEKAEPVLLTCQAGQDGECNHSLCPQVRDGEPEKSRRNCPLRWQRWDVAAPDPSHAQHATNPTKEQFEKALEEFRYQVKWPNNDFGASESQARQALRSLFTDAQWEISNSAEHQRSELAALQGENSRLRRYLDQRASGTDPLTTKLREDVDRLESELAALERRAVEAAERAEAADPLRELEQVAANWATMFANYTEQDVVRRAYRAGYLMGACAGMDARDRDGVVTEEQVVAATDAFAAHQAASAQQARAVDGKTDTSADTRRLDAIEQQRLAIGFLDMEGELNHGWWLSDRDEGPFESARAAIDSVLPNANTAAEENG